MSPDSRKLEPHTRSNQDDAMEETLDLRGLKCPLPALLAKKALAHLAPGKALTVLADDPMSVVDIPHMCHGEGHVLDGMATRDGYSEFIIRKAPD
jgi:tRNA 2-thiouridine synthesizing protein A